RSGSFVTRREHEQVRPLVDRNERIRRLEAEEADAFVNAQTLSQRRGGARQRVLAGNVEMCVHAALDQQLECREQRFVILARIEARDVEQSPWRTVWWGRRNEPGAVHAQRNRADGPSVLPGEARLILRTYRADGGQPRGRSNGEPLTYLPLRTVSDIR